MSKLKKEKIMKKLVLLTICITVLMLLVSCEIGNLHTHAYGEWETIKEATCTEDGQRARSCSCGESEKEVISAKGHTEKTVEGTPATCTESGLTEEKKCSACGEVLVKQETVAALGHDFYYNEQTDENGNTVTVVVCQRENCGEVKENTAGLYDAENNLLASWDELVNIYGLNGLSGLSVILRENENLASGTTLIIDDSITEMDLAIFEYCSNITNIMIPSSVTSISNTSWSSCVHLKNILVDENNEYYKSINGNLYDKEGKTFIQYASGKEDKEFTIPDGVETIGSGAIAYSRSLEKLYIPNSVTFIDRHGFTHCDSLSNVYFAGTTEEWEVIENKVPTKWWISGNIIIHYDGKIQFSGIGIWEAGNGSLPRFKYVVDGEKIYINNILYEQMIGVDRPEFKNKEEIISYFERNNEKINIKQVFDNENWYVLQTDSVVLLPRVAICQFDNTWYFLYLVSDNDLYHIDYIIIDLED